MERPKVRLKAWRRCYHARIKAHRYRLNLFLLLWNAERFEGAKWTGAGDVGMLNSAGHAQHTSRRVRPRGSVPLGRCPFVKIYEEDLEGTRQCSL